MSGTTKIYVIGDRNTGVLFVLFNPLRAALVSKDTIQAYADRHNDTFDGAFGKIAGVIQTLIAQTDLDSELPMGKVTERVFSTLIERGTNVSDADFCFIADVDASDWKTLRNTFIPLEPVIGTMMDSFANALSDIPDGKLQGPGDREDTGSP